MLAALTSASLAVRADEPTKPDAPQIEWGKPVGRIQQVQPHPLAVARMYSAGDRAQAIAQLDGWSEADMKAELVSLRAHLNKIGRLPERDLMAAVMLHTDRESFERLQSPVVESVRECGINEHGGYARALVSLLMVQSDATRDFARRWLTAMALSSHWDLCLDDVRRWTQEGLKWFPKDGTFRLIQGTAAEVSAQLTPTPALFANPNNRSEGVNMIAHRRQLLSEARTDLEAALALAPDEHEARLRLGRVLWRLEKPAEARAALEAVIGKAQDPSLVYLAHLYLGRVLEDGGDLPAAIERYRAALAIDPGAQAAAVALAEALVLAGEDAEGRDVLGGALGRAPRGQPRDAFMSYHLGRSDLAEGMLEKLRAETLQ